MTCPRVCLCSSVGGLFVLDSMFPESLDLTKVRVLHRLLSKSCGR